MKKRPFLVRLRLFSTNSAPVADNFSGTETVAPSRGDEHHILILASALVMLLAVVSADILLGTRFGVLLFYLIPIAWTAWQSGQNGAIGVSVLAAFSRFGVEIVESKNAGVERPEIIWSISTELLFFLIFIGLILKINAGFQSERELARSDALTKLSNARAFEIALSMERERLRRYGRTLSLVYFDLDNFKAVNDQWGHAAGDELLKIVARVVSGNIRQVDVAARLGGDEFALLLPETNDAGAKIVLERLREKLLATVRARGWPVSASFGCVTFTEAPESVGAMVKEADATMYRAKKGGKNRIETAVWNFQAPGTNA